MVYINFPLRRLFGVNYNTLWGTLAGLPSGVSNFRKEVCQVHPITDLRPDRNSMSYVPLSLQKVRKWFNVPYWPVMVTWGWDAATRNLSTSLDDRLGGWSILSYDRTALRAQSHEKNHSRSCDVSGSRKSRPGPPHTALLQKIYRKNESNKRVAFFVELCVFIAQTREKQGISLYCRIVFCGFCVRLYIAFR